MGYPAIVFSFNMGKKSGITEVRFSTGTDVVSVIRIIAPSSPVALLVVLLDRGREH